VNVLLDLRFSQQWLIKRPVFWDMTPCRLVKVKQCPRRTYCLQIRALCVIIAWRTLKMEVICSSKTSVYLHRPTRRFASEVYSKWLTAKDLMHVGNIKWTSRDRSGDIAVHLKFVKWSRENSSCKAFWPRSELGRKLFFPCVVRACARKGPHMYSVVT
jgi:hypothetical protein